MEQPLQSEMPTPPPSTTTGNYSKGKCGKWTKEYAREYMRARYRRVYSVDPTKQKKTKNDMLAEEQALVTKFGPEFAKHLEELKEKQREKRRERVKLANRYTCPLCGVEFADTEGRHRQHENTTRHKIAVETLALQQSQK